MANTTALQESSQALFCAIADIMGASESSKKLIFGSTEALTPYPTYLEFKADNNKIINKALAGITVQEKGTGISLKQMEDFLSSNGTAEFNKKTNAWYKSSVLIANEVVQKLKSIDGDFGIASPNFQDIYYFRGDKNIMGNIQALFTIANNNTEWHKLANEIKFGDVNKWNPADIYLASVRGKDKATRAIENELKEARKSGGKEYTFTDLNKLISDLINSGDLLPLSLKKAVNTAKLVPVNFEPEYKRALLSKIKYAYYQQGTKKNKWDKYKTIKKDRYGIPVDQSETRDIKIMLMLPDLCELKLRHDPSSGRKGGFKIEVKGGSARGGSIGSVDIFAQIVSFVDKKFAESFMIAFRRCEENFAKEMERLQFYKGGKGRTKIENLGRKSGVANGAEKAFNHARGEVSAYKLLNIIIPMLSQWLDKTPISKKNKLAVHLWQYITSRAKQSGKFVIAK